MLVFKRLIRRILWLLLHQWKSLSIVAWPYESCNHCGKAFKLCWSVEDRYWKKVIGAYDGGGGSMCIDCFIERALLMGVTIPKECFIIEVFY